MGLIHRRDFSRGWFPDADAVNCPENALLRMDNCILDEKGAVALRPGSAKINSAAYSDGTSGDIVSLYTTSIGGTVYRMVGVRSHVFANGSALGAPQVFAEYGNGDDRDDISFGSYLGQIFMARSTSKFKYNGTNLRSWGITAPAAPTAATTGADSKDFSTCAQGETDPFTATGSPNEGTLSFITGYDGTANGAAQLVNDSSSFRGTMTRTLSSPISFNTLAGGAAASDSDTIGMFVYLTDPAKFSQVSILIDVNDGTFNLDYYHFTFAYQEVEQVSLDSPAEPFDHIYADASGTALEGTDIRDAEARSYIRSSIVKDTLFQPQMNQWNFVSAKRGSFERVGRTAGKDWGTVKAIRVSYLGTASTTVAFDLIRETGGRQGNYVYRTAYVNETGTYNAISPPSAVSAEIVLLGDDATVNWAASGDLQVTHVYVYRMGGTLDGFYRVGRVAVGTTSLTDTVSDQTALLTNIKLQVDDAVPPDDIVGIAGPYYTRLLVLTATHLHPSRKLQPDNYSAGQAIRIGDGTERGRWLTLAAGGAYIGTDKNIYRLDGDGAEYEDGSINFTITPINVAYPPVCAAFAQEGNVICYLSSTGWRLFTGQDSVSINGDNDLLWRDYTRHGVSAVALPTTGSSVKRHRGTISKGILYAIVPEGASTTSSAIIYSYVFATQKWYRSTYPQAFRSIAREPDGTVISGDGVGFTRIMNTGTADDGAGIAITNWTRIDDANLVRQRKDPQKLILRIDSGGTSMGCAVHLDGSGSQAINVNPSSNGEGNSEHDITSIAAFQQVQLRITGTVTTWKLYEWSVEANLFPQLMFGQIPEIHLNGGNRAVLRGLNIKACTLGSQRTFTIYIDDAAIAGTYTLTTGTDEPDSKNFSFSGSFVGRDLYFSVDGNIELYSVEPVIFQRIPAPVFVGEEVFPGEGMEVAMSGFEITACNSGTSTTVVAEVDDVGQGGSAIFSGTDGIIETKQGLFAATVIGTKINLLVSGTPSPIEILEWHPIVMYKMPQYRKVWDTGFVNLHDNNLNWVRFARIKVKASAAITVTPYFDGTAATAKTLTPTSPTDPKVYDVFFGREYKGSQPRIVLTSTTQFQPYWVEFVYRSSGLATEKRTLRVSAVSET